MSFPSQSSHPSGGRHGLASAVLFSILVCGCFSDPKIDTTQPRHCQSDKSCPSGFVCGANGLCCASADGKTCNVLPPSNGLDATAFDSPPVSDGPIREAGLGTGGVTGLDGGLDMVSDGPPDVPQGAGGSAGAGGVADTGSTGGAGGSSKLDAPGADASDAPLSGSGGVSGSGGSGSGGSGSGGSSSGGGTGTAGQTCQTSGTCAPGLSCSADGHCCDRACTAPCESCETGVCTPVTGTPHTGHGSCTGSSADCGGSCTGAADGQCTWVTTACGQASCTTLTNAQSQPTGTNFLPQGTCSAGACVPGTAISCPGGLVCASATACRTSCASDADCLTGNACSGGACVGKKANGATCNSSNECQLGNCVDGVCCESACTAKCMACSQAKTGATNGYCRSVTVGTDPDSECAVDASNPCGFDGTCDGAGACRYQSSSVSCGATSCTGEGRYTPLGHCNGGGACTPSAAGACPNNLLCASSTSCATTCTPNSTTGCPLGYKCTASGTSCVLATMPCGGTTCPIANGGGECCFYNSSSSGTTYAERCIPVSGVDCATYSPSGQYDDILCHSKTDCPAGQICCLYIGSVVFGWSVKCALPTDSQCLNGTFNSAYQVCDPTLSPTECSSGTCTGAALVDWGNPSVITCQ